MNKSAPGRVSVVQKAHFLSSFCVAAGLPNEPCWPVVENYTGKLAESPLALNLFLAFGRTLCGPGRHAGPPTTGCGPAPGARVVCTPLLLFGGTSVVLLTLLVRWASHLVWAELWYRLPVLPGPSLVRGKQEKDKS